MYTVGLGASSFTHHDMIHVLRTIISELVVLRRVAWDVVSLDPVTSYLESAGLSAGMSVVSELNVPPRFVSMGVVTRFVGHWGVVPS